jgi:hypothetical protein
LPEIATNPNYAGSRQVRPYTFQDGHLIFTDIAKNEPNIARWRIVWEKAR